MKTISCMLLITVALTACAGPNVEQGYLEPYRYQRGLHTGVDLSGYLGEPVYAIDSGTVVGAGPELVKVQHGNGQVVTYYHVGTVRVQLGQQVQQAQQLAELALTGVRGPHDSRTIGRPHLHLELHAESGRGLDPLSLKMTCDKPGPRWPVGCR